MSESVVGRPIPTSAVGEELLGARALDAVDGAHPDQSPIVDQVVDDGAGRLAGRGRRGPRRLEPGADQTTLTSLDGVGDDPLELEGAVVELDDRDRAGVLGSGLIGAVDGVDAAQPIGIVTADGEVAGKGREVEEDEGGGDAQDPEQTTLTRGQANGRSVSGHEGEASETAQPDRAAEGHELDDAHQVRDPGQLRDPDEFRLPRWMKVGLGLFSVFVVAAIAFAVFEPIQVLPRIRIAPGYALTASDGSVVTSETNRGVVTLYTFSSVDCDDRCEAIADIMAEVRDRVPQEADLGGTEFRLVTIAVDSELWGERTPSGDVALDRLAATARSSGADGSTWRWVGGDADEISNVVGAGFGRYLDVGDDTVSFDPGFVLVDGLGVVRGDYRYDTLAETADKLVSHVAILGQELRYADGAGAVAYEAAHLFLCYP